MTPILTLRNIEVAWNNGPRVLRIDELAIERGELLAIVGPNGSGKSTLLQTMNLLQPYKGEITLFGKTPADSNLTDLRRRCSLVFQEALLLDGCVAENIAWPLRFRGLSAAARMEKVHRALSDFGCEHLAGRSAKNLSGGEAQRVCIARALVTEPELLLLDEPFTALDISIRSSLMEEIRSVAQQRGITVVLVSHCFSDVLDFANRAVVLIAGQIRQDDRPQILLRRPMDLSVAQLVGMDNLLPCRIESRGDRTLVILPGGIHFMINRGQTESASVCCLPGDALVLLGAQEKELTAELNVQENIVIVEGIIERVNPGFGSYRILVRSADLILQARLPREVVESKLQIGFRVRLGFDQAEAHLI